MKFVVEAWAPEYGASTGDEVLAPSEVDADATVEVAPPEWAPRRPPPGTTPVDDLLVIDGVQRVDALVWITGGDRGDPSALDTRVGLCGSYAAGAVRCTPGRAITESVEVGRGVFSSAAVGDSIRTRHGAFVFHPCAGEEPGRLRLALHGAMIDLEARLAARAGDAEVVLVDGPLRKGHTHRAMVGFIKTHARAYGPQIVGDTIAALREGERTPLLVIGDHPRFTWYLRLPGPRSHPWAGIVRLEASAQLGVAEVTSLADRLCLTLPGYASTPHKDSRAPQNLVPIGGLERELRRRLGDARLMLRALQESAAAPQGV